jgi:hypothetical protein
MIHLLWCTIRPETFKQIYPYWIGRSKNPKNIKTHIAVNSESHSNIIKEYFKLNNQQYRIITVNTDKIGVCYPSYQLSSTTEGQSGDIVVFASDDFLPPQNWDEYLINKLENREGGLIVRDGYQLPDSSNMEYPAITIPIMTWGCFEKLNKTIYNPVYTHMYSDCELYINLKDMGLLIDERMTDTTLFEHLHHLIGKRNADGSDHSYNYKRKEDELIWNKRKNIPVLERI